MLTPRMCRMMVLMLDKGYIRKEQQNLWRGQWFYSQINFIVSEGYATKSKNPDNSVTYSLTKEGELRAKIFKEDLGIKGDLD